MSSAAAFKAKCCETAAFSTPAESVAAKTSSGILRPLWSSYNLTCRSKSSKAGPSGSFKLLRRIADNIAWNRRALRGSNSSQRSLQASEPCPSGAERTFFMAVSLTNITIKKYNCSSNVWSSARVARARGASLAWALSSRCFMRPFTAPTYARNVKAQSLQVKRSPENDCGFCISRVSTTELLSVVRYCWDATESGGAGVAVANAVSRACSRLASNSLSTSNCTIRACSSVAAITAARHRSHKMPWVATLLRATMCRPALGHMG